MKIDCLYELFWYELDQSIQVGQQSEFYFLKNSKPLKFLNGLYEPDEGVLHKCVIQSIRHPDFGSISEINTSGLDYSIRLRNGTKFSVEAEENPGHVYDYPIKPTTWIFSVIIETVA